MVPVALVVICLVQPQGEEGGSTPLESLVNDSAAGPSLPLINPNAAGIDVGAKEHLFKMFYPSLF
jgi:hypothetical protein